MVQKLEIAGTVVPFCGKVNAKRDGNDELRRKDWCRRRGSNPHDAKHHWILSPTRLPVPPLRRGNDYTVSGGKILKQSEGRADTVGANTIKLVLSAT
jgi:hypothetical protein